MTESTRAPAPHLKIQEDVVGGLVRDRSIPGLMGVVEAGLGLIAMGFFSFVIVLICGLLVLMNAWLYGYPRLEPHTIVLLAMLWAPLALLEWRSLTFFTDGLSGAAHPAPVHVATQLRDRGILARVAIALWWLAHAATVVLVAEWMTRQWKFYNPSAAERVMAFALPVLVLFGTAYAMNTHLLIALYALTRSERLVRGVYRLRTVLDLAVVFLLPRLTATTAA